MPQEFQQQGGAATSNFGTGYIDSYDTTTQAVGVANTLQDLNFGVDNEIVGWTHTPGTGVFTCQSTGLYLISVEVNLENNAGGSQTGEIVCIVNGVEVPGSQKGRDLAFTNEGLSLPRTFLARVNATETLQIQFTGSSTAVQAVPCPNPSGTTLATSAKLTCTRVE